MKTFFENNKSSKFKWNINPTLIKAICSTVHLINTGEEKKNKILYRNCNFFKIIFFNLTGTTVDGQFVHYSNQSMYLRVTLRDA